MEHQQLIERALAVEDWKTCRYPSRSQASVDLGLKLFRETHLEKDWLTIAACMYLAEHVTEENLMSDGDLVDTPEDCELLWHRMNQVAMGNVNRDNPGYTIVERPSGVIVEGSLAIKTLPNAESCREAYFMHACRGDTETVRLIDSRFISYDSSMLVMEAGQMDLVRALGQDIPFKREWVIDALKGLVHLHGLGIAHGDVKPANFLLGYDGHVKVCDFGSCFYADLKPRGRWGTPNYMCWEMLTDPTPRAYGLEIDVWSMGITLAELESGTVPFIRSEKLPLEYGDDQEAFMASLVEDAKVKLETVEGIAARMLAIEPSDRPGLKEVLRIYDWRARVVFATIDLDHPSFESPAFTAPMLPYFDETKLQQIPHRCYRPGYESKD